MNSLLYKINQNINKSVHGNVSCREWHSSIIIEGRVKTWEDVIRAGDIAANKGYKGVVNRLEVENLNIPEMKVPVISDNSLQGKRVDVLIIGAGIIGSAVARELSKWDISILLIDKEEDVAMHASSRNDGMVHPGIEPRPGSKKAYYNVKGNEMYTKVTEELDVPFRRSGSVVLFKENWIKIFRPIIMARAKKNRVPGVQMISREEVKSREPYVTQDIAGALYFPTTGVIPPYKMTVAYAENAVMNGVQISLSTAVLSIEKDKSKIVSVKTNRGTIYPSVIVNAAGVYSDKIADMAGDQFFTIHPRKGEIAFLDKKKGKYLNSVVALPSLKLAKGHTKGGGLVKTYEGNILVGPDAYEQPYKEDFSTHRENVENMLRRHITLVSQFSMGDVITYCAGTRAATYEEDFIVEKSEYIDNLVYAAGIQSPGFASAPAIALDVENITCKILKKVKEVKKKEHWNPRRKGIPDLKNMTFEERYEIIKKRPDYGIIICRCEEISKGEIVDALHSPVPVNTLDGIKRRVRAGMGRCQGGFCTPAVMEIFSEENHRDLLSITKKGGKSNMLKEETKLTGYAGVTDIVESNEMMPNLKGGK